MLMLQAVPVIFLIWIKEASCVRAWLGSLSDLRRVDYSTVQVSPELKSASNSPAPLVSVAAATCSLI